MKKKRKIIFIIVLAIAFILIGGIFLLNAFIGTDKFKGMLTGMMEKQLQAKVNIDQWEASIFSGMQFTNLSVDQPAGFGKGKLLETDRFTIKFNLWDLLKKKITFSQIIIDDLSVNLNQNEKGLWFFQTASFEDNEEEEKQDVERQGEAAGTSVPVENLIILAETVKIKNANFLARDHDGNVVGELKDANIDGKVDIQGSRNNVSLNLNSTAIALSKEITGLNGNISISNLDANVKVGKNTAQVQNLTFDIFDGNVQAKIVALDYLSDQPEVDIELRINNVGAAPILAIVNQPSDMIVGPLTCSLSTKFRIGSIEYLDGFMEILEENQYQSFTKIDHDTLPMLCKLLDNIDSLESSLALDKVHLKNIANMQNLIIENMSLPIRINKRTIVLDKSEIGIWDGKFLTSLSANIDTDSIGLNIGIELKEINSTPLMAAVNLDESMIEGRLNSQITFEGSVKDPLPFSLEKIENVIMDSSISMGEIFTAHAGKVDELSISCKLLNGNVLVSPLSIKAYKGDVQAILSADKLLSEKPSFDTNITINNIDGTTLLKSIGQDPELLSGDLNVKLTAKGSGNTLDNLDIDSHMEMGPVTVMKDISIDKITIPIRLEGGRLNMQPIIKAFQGEFKATINADNLANLQSETAELLPSFEIESYISNMDSDSLLRAAKVDPRMLSGPLTLGLGAKGRGDSFANLDAQVLFNIPSVNVEIGGTEVHNVTGELHLANQVAIFKDFGAEVFDGSISVQGSYALSNNECDANVKLESLDMAKAMESVVKDFRHVKYLLDTTSVMTGTATGMVKVAGYSDNIDSLKGNFDFSINDGVVAGHPIQKRLAKVLGSPEFDNIEFSKISTSGSLDGLLVNLDYLDLESENIALSAADGIIDMENDMLVIPIEIGLSPKIAAKLDKPVKEIRYGLTEKEDGLEYLPVFRMTGNISNPDIKKALVEVVLKSAATGFLRRKVFKTVDSEEGEVLNSIDSGVDEEEKDVKGILGDVLEGILGDKIKEEGEEGEAGNEDKKKSRGDLIRDMIGF